MDSRGEGFACGTPEGRRRRGRETATELRDEGRSASSTGRVGPPDSRRFGVAPSGIKDPESKTHRIARDAEASRWRTSPAVGESPVLTSVRPRHQAREPADRTANLLADVGGCSISIDRTWRITGVTAEAAAWIELPETVLIG